MAQSKSVVRSVVVGFACVSMVAAPAAGQSQLAGVANFRDIGGYRTSDGHKIKRHVIYRSGELSGSTASDQQVFKRLQIRYEIDLRTDQERRESPSRWGENPPEVISISVGTPRNGNATQSIGSLTDVRTEAQARQRMQAATARIAIEGAPDIGAVLQRLAKGDEPALIHCTAGKDRTGVAVAVLMTLLRVPRAEVLDEYVKSNESVEQQLERERMREQAGASSLLPQLAPDVLRKFMGAEASYLEAAFNAIDKKYGSFDAYAKDGLKVTPQQVQALRATLLEP